MQRHQPHAIQSGPSGKSVGKEVATDLIDSATPSHMRIDNSTNFPSIFRKPVRVTITLPHNIYMHLKKRSDEEGRSLSNLAAFLIEKSLD
ncbi:MAG: ribbon-helix-helix domain-containing protein [Cyanobium sp.]